MTKLPPTTPLRRSNSEPLIARNQGSLSRPKTLLAQGTAKSTSRLKLADLGESTRHVHVQNSNSLLRKISVKPSPRLTLADLAEPAAQESAAEADVYWPLSFLPSSCPNARVFTWGYHTHVVDKKPLPRQGNIFDHAGELLVELAGARGALGSGARPIIFVAHSTGGVLVKEVTAPGPPWERKSDCGLTRVQLLRLSEAERDGPLNEVLLSTSAVVFLASPHRGSGHCNLGGAIKSMASITLPIDPSDPVLQELCGANSVAVELGRQTFIRLWSDYNFRVKTFQESVIPSYKHPEPRAGMVSCLPWELERFLTRIDLKADCELPGGPPRERRDHRSFARQYLQVWVSAGSGIPRFGQDSGCIYHGRGGSSKDCTTSD